MSEQIWPIKMHYVASKEETKSLNTDQLRDRFMLEDLFAKDEIRLAYTDADRAIVGGVSPISGALSLNVGDQLRSEYFCERRELGVVNIGEGGCVSVDGQTYELENLEALYVGRGAKDISFSNQEGKSAQFYLISYPAHTQYPTTKAKLSEVKKLDLGTSEASNERIIYQFVHPDGIKSCQLMLGITLLKPGSVWNTMPAHLHDRRSEIYLYFNLEKPNTVFHFMGEPSQTKHICMRSHQGVISPAWSIHSGCGTSNYGFIWAMGGENQRFDDMDSVDMEALR